MRTVFSGAKVVAAAAVGMATTAFAVPSMAEGADKFPLVGPNANIWCDSLTPLPGDAPDPGPGFVIFNKSGNKVSALVKLHKAAPRMSYEIRLLQGPNDDCYRVDGVLTTNRRGNGALRLTETDVGRRAQVIIDTGSIFMTPTYRGTRFFRTS